MKHQYFGDVNDYRKYGLLRVLQSVSGLRLGVCWMLTPNDGRHDGNFTAYLNSPKEWRRHDPALFDTLAEVVPIERHLRHVDERELLPSALLFTSQVPDGRTGRAEYFWRCREAMQGVELVFFDPDNGIEVNSCPPGSRGSSKYVAWSEIVDTYQSGKSVLIYQHFPRQPREAFIQRVSGQLAEKTGSQFVACCRTTNVGFFLAATAEHSQSFKRAVPIVEALWEGQISVKNLDVNGRAEQGEK
jgi:hypothetical protein